MHPSQLVRCWVYVRHPVPGGYTYTSVLVRNWEGSLNLVTFNPPEKGDTFFLYDDHAKKGWHLKVVVRDWAYSSYGSADWPYGETLPKTGPRLTLICIEEEGPFRHQIVEKDDEEQQEKK